MLSKGSSKAGHRGSTIARATIRDRIFFFIAISPFNVESFSIVVLSCRFVNMIVNCFAICGDIGKSAVLRLRREQAPALRCAKNFCANKVGFPQRFVVGGRKVVVRRMRRKLWVKFLFEEKERICP